MESTEIIFTSDLPTKINELKEVMFQKGYSNYQIRVYTKVWDSLLIYTNEKPVQKFNENLRQEFLENTYADLLEKRDAMYKITRAMNMLTDYIQFHVIFRQYCTPKTGFSEELKYIFIEFLKAEQKRNYSDNTYKVIRVRLMRFHDYLFDVGIRDFKCVSREHINAYILSLARFSTTYISEALREIRRLLKLAYETRTTDYDLSECVPHVKNIRQQKLPSIFSVDEIEKITSSVDRSNPIGKRNYAIFSLLLN